MTYEASCYRDADGVLFTIQYSADNRGCVAHCLWVYSCSAEQLAPPENRPTFAEFTIIVDGDIKVVNSDDYMVKF